MRLILVLLIALLPTPAWAAIRYVATTGSDANDCTASQNIATPKLTFASMKACFASGDTLYVRAGTYTTQLDTNGVSGTDEAHRITVAVYPGETVTIRTTNYARPFKQYANQGYITYDGFVFDGINAGDARVTSTGTWITSGMHHITLQNLEIKNWQTSGIYVSGANNVIIRNNTIHDQVASPCVTGNRWYGIYFHDGSNGVIEGNNIYNNPGGGMQIYLGPISNLMVKKNRVHDNNDCLASEVGGIIVGAAGGQTVSGVTIADNEIVNNGSAVVHGGAPGIRVIGIASGTAIYNNTIYNNKSASDGSSAAGYGIKLEFFSAGIPTGTIIKNNINTGNQINSNNFGGGATATETHTACTAGENCSATNKITISSITSCTPSTSVFTQKSGSVCINAGTPLAGYLYNGTAPDIGAYESVSHSTCVVDNGEATTLKITFDNNVASPLLPATGMTGFTARKSTANDVVTATTRTGDNQVFLTLTTPIVNGDTVDYSYTPGNVTDSSRIGNTTNQPLLTITQQTCTNNVGAAATQTFTHAAFEFHGLRGTEAAPVGTPYATAPENTNILVHAGGAVRLRIAVTCTNQDCQPTGFFPRYSKTLTGGSPGAYTVVPDVFGADGIAFFGTGPDPDIPSNGTPTTEQLSPSGTFVAGALVRTSNAIPTVDMAQNGKTELEYVLAFGPTAAANATYDIRLYKQDGTPLDAYTVTPRITIMPCGMMMGF